MLSYLIKPYQTTIVNEFALHNQGTRADNTIEVNPLQYYDVIDARMSLHFHKGFCNILAYEPLSNAIFRMITT